MLARAFQAGSKTEDGVRCKTLGSHANQLGLPLGQGAGLVQYQGVDPGQGFQRRGVAHQHARGCPATHAHHHGHGRGQAQRAGAGNDEHSDCVHQSVGQSRLGPDQRPHDKGDQRRGHDRRHEPSRHAVSQPGNGCAAALGLAHPPHDLGQQGAGTHALGAHDKTTRAVVRAARHSVAGSLVHGQGFSGDHGFVERAGALLDHAVDRNALAWPHPEPIPHQYLLDGNLVVRAVRGDPARALRRQTQKRADGAAGGLACSQFQHLAQQYQGGDGRRRLEVERRGRPRLAERGRQRTGKQGRDHAKAECRPSAQPDEGEHVRATLNKRSPRTQQKRPAGSQHHPRGQRHLDQGQRTRRKKVHSRVSEHHLGHGVADQWRRQAERDPETPGHVGQFGVGQFLQRYNLGFQCHAALRACAGPVAAHAFAHRAQIARRHRPTGRRGRLRWVDSQARSAQPDQPHPGHTHGPEARRQKRLRRRLETGQARRVAEIVQGALVLGLASRFRGVDHHSANRIPFRHVLPCREM